MIINKDQRLTEGYLVPIHKPGKDPNKPESYRPVNLLSMYRKLLSSIILDRITPIVEKTMSLSQYAYRPGRSTGDIVLAHKFMIAGALMKGLDAVCVGIDMSKAFDTVDRDRLVTILRSREVPEGDLTMIKNLLKNTSLTVKRGKSKGEKFETNIGVPQGDSLSPRLFTIYLDEALKELDAEIERNDHHNNNKTKYPNLHDHDYPKKNIPELPKHLEYADDVDFFCKNQEEAEYIVEKAKSILKKYNLQVNESKTEITKYSRGSCLRKTKKLGTILDEIAEFNKRKQFTSLAMIKYRKIWRNKYITTKKKMDIYNTYVRPIYLYNCSTWTSNKSSDNKLDSFHRKQLRQALNIYYPKIIKNEDLYKITKQGKISDFVRVRRGAHLGHILRRNTPTRDTLHNIWAATPKGRLRSPQNLIKTYCKDLQSSNFHNWVTRASTRRL